MNIYMNQGFIALQRLVDIFILNKTGSYTTELELTAQPFPTLAHTDDSTWKS